MSSLRPAIWFRTMFPVIPLCYWWGGCSSHILFPPPLLIYRQDYAPDAILLHFMDYAAASEANSSITSCKIIPLVFTTPCIHHVASTKGSQVCVTKVSGRQEKSPFGMSALDLFKNKFEELDLLPDYMSCDPTWPEIYSEKSQVKFYHSVWRAQKWCSTVRCSLGYRKQLSQQTSHFHVGSYSGNRAGRGRYRRDVWSVQHQPKALQQ